MVVPFVDASPLAGETEHQLSDDLAVQLIFDSKEIKALNNYFREFVLAHNYCSPWSQDSMNRTFEKIQKQKNTPFHSSWDYLMIVVEIIEEEWGFEKIIIQANWVRFISDKFGTFQDKGSSKIEALYLCCFRILTELWKEQKPPFVYKSHEPFDDIDLE